MDGIYKIRDIFGKLYRDYGGYLTAFGKFAAALILFLQINSKVGSMAALNNIFVVLIMALFCSFCPTNTMVVFGMALALAHLGGASIAALVVGGGILLIVLLLYFSFVPEQAWAFVLTFIGLAFHMPGAIPLGFGLMGTLPAGFAIASGTVVYYTLAAVGGSRSVDVQLAMAEQGAGEELFADIRGLLDAVLKEQEMILMLIVLLAVFAVVYFARRMAMKYAWTVAIAAGTLIYLVLMSAGWLMLDMETGMVWILAGTLPAVLIAVILELFFFHLDYKRTEKLQFEDDEYYYYVQAVPKKRSERENKRRIDRKGRERSGGNETIYP